jgi:hypothetical protein
VPGELSPYLAVPAPPGRRRSSAVGIALAVVVLGAVVAAGLQWRAHRLVAARSTGGGVVASGHVPTSELRAGDCLSALPGGTTTGWVDLVPCAAAHTGQVFDVGALPDGGFPGADSVRSAVRDQCALAWNDGQPSEARAGAATRRETLAMLLPTASGWSSGDRGYACVVASAASG